MSSSKSQKSSSEEGIQKAGQQAYARSEQTPAEAQQYAGSFDIGKILNQIMQYQLGMGQAPAGFQGPEQQYQNQGPLAQQYYNQTLQGTQSPYAAYESQLQPSLQLAQDYINRGAQQRGLLRSGIPIEQMGRAGVDLAIKEAQDRMNFRNQELARGGQLSQYTQGVGQQNIANLANLYGQQQSYGQQSMGRQAQAAQGAAQYQAYPYQASLGSYYGGQGQLGAGIGGGVGGVLGSIPGFATGNPALALQGAAIGGYGGSQIGRAF